MKWLVQAPGTAERNYVHWASDLQKAEQQPPLKRLPDPRPPSWAPHSPPPAPGNLDFSKVSLTYWQHCLPVPGRRWAGVSVVFVYWILGCWEGGCTEPVNSGHEVIEKLLEEVTIARLLLLAHKQAIKVNLSSVEIGI